MRRVLLLPALALASSCGSRTSPSAAPVPPPVSAPAEEDAAAPANVVTSVDVANGDAELVDDRWVVYRDSQKHLRVRPVAPRSYPLSSGGVTLSLGDRATSGDWEIQWAGVRDGQVTFRASHRNKVVDEWKADLELRPTHEIASATKLLHFEVTLTAVHGEMERAGASITITGDSVEHATSARLGQSLKPGFYVFPDGLRIRVEQIASCDFDTSVPCFGGTYRAEALLGAEDARVEWSTKTTRLLGYTLTLSNFEIVVRK
jgi:hypothetical protein